MKKSFLKTVDDAFNKIDIFSAYHFCRRGVRRLLFPAYLDRTIHLLNVAKYQKERAVYELPEERKNRYASEIVNDLVPQLRRVSFLRQPMEKLIVSYAEVINEASSISDEQKKEVLALLNVKYESTILPRVVAHKDSSKNISDFQKQRED